MNRLPATVFLVLLSAPAAGEPYLVRDIVTDTYPVGSNAADYTIVGDQVFFMAQTQGSALDLWRSDGTAAGTERVREICPVSFCSLSGWRSADESHLLFVKDGFLWRSDGTEAGTFPLTEDTSTGSLGFGKLLLKAGDRWIFEGAHESRGALWRTDLTREGTEPFFDFPPVIRFSSSLRTELDDQRILFEAPSEDQRLGLWVSDGTTAGTVFLLRSLIGKVVASGGRAFFFAVSDETGLELWTTDGTPEGTRLTRDVTPGPESTSDLIDLFMVGGLGYFFRDRQQEGVRELWRSDGTEAGTLLLREFVRPAFTEPWGLVSRRGGTAYFTANDGVHGLEIWRTDGTPEGTRLVDEICAGNCGFPSTPTLTDAGDRSFFVASDEAHGLELRMLRDDKITLVADLCPGTCSTVAGALREFGGDVLFLVFEQDGKRLSELWRSGGTAAGTRRVAAFDDPPGVTAIAPAGVGGRLLFTADGGEGLEPWVTDGTSAELLGDLTPARGIGSNPQLLTPLGDRVLFFAGPQSPHGDPCCTHPAGDLWVSDGTAEGTRMLAALGVEDRDSITIRRLGDRVLLAVGLPGPGMFDVHYELWASDGTVRGTRRLAGNEQYFDSQRRIDLDRSVELSRDELLFLIDDAIWSTDGTPAGTRRRAPESLSAELSRPFALVGSSVLFYLAELPFSLWRYDLASGEDEELFSGAADNLLVVDGAAYFTGPSPMERDEIALWRSDGTRQGTTLVHGFPAADEASNIVFHGHAGSRIYFSVRFPADCETEQRFESWSSDGTEAGTLKIADFRFDSGRPLGDGFVLWRRERIGSDDSDELWWSDGTAAGTRLLLPWNAQQNIRFLAADGERAYFTDESTLWVTDGTADGTLDLAPFAGRVFDLDPRATRLPAASGERFFVGADRTDLWRTDGTREGTVRVADFADLNGVSWLTFTGDRAFFNADGGYFLGTELWAMPIWDLFAGDPTMLTAGDAARFRVEVEWSDGRHMGRGQVAPLRSLDSGLFWFFSDSNWEMLVKVLDGCAINDRFWVFTAATTTVEYTLVVTDTATGEVKRYENPLGRAAVPVADTEAFDTCGAPLTSHRSSPALAAAAKSVCPDGAGLCLGPEGRYRVTVAWDDGTRQGTATPVPGSADSGLFWFFSESNWEMLVKVLNGCALGGHRWVFAAATTTVAYELRVEDALTGAVKVYRNPQGRVAETVTDTTAFDCD